MNDKLNIEPEIHINLETFGCPSKETILLISGAGAPAAFWPTDFCKDLVARGSCVIRFDHRDTGASTHLEEPYSMDTLAQDLITILARLKVPNIHLVGHSMGGYLIPFILSGGITTAVTSAISISAGPTNDPNQYNALRMSLPREETWLKLMENKPTGDFEADLEGWLTSWKYLNGKRPLDSRLATDYTAALYSGDKRNAEVAVNHIHAMTTLPVDLPQRLKNINLPFEVIHGSEDMLVPVDNGRALHRLITGSTFHCLEGAGHMFFTPETWAEIADRIENMVMNSLATR